MSHCTFITTPTDDGRWHHKCINCGRPRTLSVETFHRNCDGGAEDRLRRGPGGELARLLAEIGAEPTSGKCSCAARAREMDGWGIDGCRERREEIKDWLREAYKGTSWRELFAAISAAAKSGLALRINPLDPFGSLLDEAIRRAEAETKNPMPA